jgi:mannosyltransferase OCH1-like enzyme
MRHTLILNPGLDIRFYDDAACERYVIAHFPARVAKAYRALKPPAFKADLFRYCVLYWEGGIWGDVWQDYRVPFEDVIDFSRDRLFLVRDRLSAGTPVYDVQISFIAALPRLPIFMDAIDAVCNNVKTKHYGCSSLSVTGPNLFGNVLRSKHPGFPYTMIALELGGRLEMLDGLVICITKPLKMDRPELSGTYNREWYKRNVYGDLEE